MACGFIAFFVFGIIGAKALYLSTNADLRSQYRTAQNAVVERGVIKDRNGKVLATSLPVMILHADPALMLDPFETALPLRLYFQNGLKNGSFKNLPKRHVISNLNGA